ncbi:hypothetical protein PR048_025048 [Dryococelus australis]|uniref:Transposase n=1 Tax=Dryococelus australis TaxID=614101 RepID=A0ABQ9GQD5_9NEOP|nr:hypothetical protein PR048_025048 [Dryococelus australis]
MDYMFFSDKATLHTCGHKNSHNCLIWAEEQPNVLEEWQQNTPRVTVWLGMMRTKVNEPAVFAEDTVTGNTYLDMLKQFLEPQLVDDGIMGTVVFQQNGAPPHFSLIDRDYLNLDAFSGRWISHGLQRFYAPCSPDLNPPSPLIFCA